MPSTPPLMMSNAPLDNSKAHIADFMTAAQNKEDTRCCEAAAAAFSSDGDIGTARVPVPVPPRSDKDEEDDDDSADFVRLAPPRMSGNNVSFVAVPDVVPFVQLVHELLLLAFVIVHHLVDEGG